MKKIKTTSDLESFRQSILERHDSDKKVIRICNTGCRGRGSSRVVEAFQKQISEQNLGDRVTIKTTGCHGLCEMGSVLVIEPDNIFYKKVKPEYVSEILSETIVKGNVLERLLYEDPKTGEKILREANIPFYKKQTKAVSHNVGNIDPTSIEDYISAGGYSALSKALTTMTPGEVIESIETSGLRGRGGAGFITGQKWRIARESREIIRYIIANGDEGDPGAFMDRSMMEGDPQSIIEGMIIGAYAIAAHKGFIYVRHEYPIAIKHLSTAIQQAEAYGLLGTDILSTGFDFTLKINRGAGAFVCGEETALIRSIEGKSGVPTSRPPFPAIKGLWGRSTIINNVETFANVPLIINEGAGAYSDTGTAKSKGTKIFSLVGDVRNTGLVEVPMGITLHEIIYDIGRGIKNDKRFKAVQTGGPSGGCIPASKIDISVDYDSLKTMGAIMGSGGMIVMDENTCMVELARYFIDFLMYESCGKCVPCREGLKQMHEVLSNICEGHGEKGDIELLEGLSSLMAEGSLCGLGRTAANPVLSTINYFRHEYEAHILDKKCPAGVCRNLFEYFIDETLCDGCTLCRVKCPEDAISGEKKKLHVIDPSKCIKCGICYSLCKKEAVRKR